MARIDDIQAQRHLARVMGSYQANSTLDRVLEFGLVDSKQQGDSKDISAKLVRQGRLFKQNANRTTPRPLSP